MKRPCLTGYYIQKTRNAQTVNSYKRKKKFYEGQIKIEGKQINKTQAQVQNKL